MYSAARRPLPGVVMQEPATYSFESAGLSASNWISRTGSYANSWFNLSDWRILPHPSNGCPERGAYSCIVSGDAAVEQVLCLHRQLNRWGPTCPLLVYYDGAERQTRAEAAEAPREGTALLEGGKQRDAA